MTGASGRPAEVVTVTADPALDWTLSVPGFTAGAINRVEAQLTTPAGKGVNVAAALAGAGHRVAVTGWLGRDNAAPFEAFFAAKGIEDRFVRVNFPGQPPSPAERTALMERVLGLASTAATGAPGWFVLAGSLPPGVDPGFYCELTTLVTAAGARVALDTSGEALRRAVKSEPQVLTPNVHELEALVGTPLSSRAAIVAAQPPRVAVRTTVGAGDAMVAGIVAGRLRRLELDELARLASAFALGAVTGTASEEWLVQVMVQEVP